MDYCTFTPPFDKNYYYNINNFPNFSNQQNVPSFYYALNGQSEYINCCNKRENFETHTRHDCYQGKTTSVVQTTQGFYFLCKHIPEGSRH